MTGLQVHLTLSHFSMPLLHSGCSFCPFELHQDSLYRWAHLWSLHSRERASSCAPLFVLSTCLCCETFLFLIICLSVCLFSYTMRSLKAGIWPPSPSQACVWCSKNLCSLDGQSFSRLSIFLPDCITEHPLEPFLHPE